MENYTIFLVEDDPWYGEILEFHLSRRSDINVIRYSTGEECLANLSNNPALITIDYFLPDMSGEELFQNIRSINPDIPVIVISSQENVSTAVSLLKLGVHDYLVKDENTKDLLWNSLNRILENRKLRYEVEQLRSELDKKYSFESTIKGSSDAIKNVLGLLTKAAKTNISVSIIGETGTGKDLIAKAIHYNSDRRSKPLVTVNVTSFSTESLEVELFGCHKPTIVGLIDKPGKIEEAAGGTLFLNDISEMDLNLQARLLRTLQQVNSNSVYDTGKPKTDIRVIIGSQKKLSDEVKRGLFREDLFYHIMGLPIELPPLRLRTGDQVILAKYFLEEFCRENDMPLLRISTEAKEKLLYYSYPGNVRELKAIIELAAVICDDLEITANHINFALSNNGEFFIREDRTLKEYTITIIQHYLKKYDKNVMAVAEKLDIGKSTIYKMIQNNEVYLS